MSDPVIILCIFAGTFFGTLLTIGIGILGWYWYQRFVKGLTPYQILMNL